MLERSVDAAVHASSHSRRSIMSKLGILGTTALSLALAMAGPAMAAPHGGGAHGGGGGMHMGGGAHVGGGAHMGSGAMRMGGGAPAVRGAHASAGPAAGGNVVSGGVDPAYCAQRYKSWDPASGTYLGYDGLRHPCGE